MAVHTSVNQGVARPNAQNDVLASPSATPQIMDLRQDMSLAQGEVPTQGKQREQRSAGNAELGIGAAALVAGGAIAVVAALFAAGFMRTPIERALRRLLDRIEVVELPLVLPVTIAEIVREIRANSRIVSEMREQQPAA